MDVNVLCVLCTVAYGLFENTTLLPGAKGISRCTMEIHFLL